MSDPFGGDSDRTMMKPMPGGGRQPGGPPSQPPGPPPPPSRPPGGGGGEAIAITGGSENPLLQSAAPLFALTNGPIYDRYLQVWVVLLPLVWMLWTRRWMQIALGIVLAGMLAYFVREHLV